VEVLPEGATTIDERLALPLFESIHRNPRERDRVFDEHWVRAKRAGLTVDDRFGTEEHWQRTAVPQLILHAATLSPSFRRALADASARRIAVALVALEEAPADGIASIAEEHNVAIELHSGWTVRVEHLSGTHEMRSDKPEGYGAAAQALADGTRSPIARHPDPLAKAQDAADAFVEGRAARQADLDLPGLPAFVGPGSMPFWIAGSSLIEGGKEAGLRRLTSYLGGGAVTLDEAALGKLVAAFFHPKDEVIGERALGDTFRGTPPIGLTGPLGERTHGEDERNYTFWSRNPDGSTRSWNVLLQGKRTVHLEVLDGPAWEPPATNGPGGPP
jgi:hypothetical protein